MQLKYIGMIIIIYLSFVRCVNLGNRSDAGYWFVRGNTLYQDGKLEQAISCWTEALRLNPEYAVAYYNRGIARMGIDENDRGHNDFQKACKLNPYLWYREGRMSVR